MLNAKRKAGIITWSGATTRSTRSRSQECFTFSVALWVDSTTLGRYHNVERRHNQMDQIEEPGVLIVGFELKASSIDHRYEVPPSSFSSLEESAE